MVVRKVAEDAKSAVVVNADGVSGSLDGRVGDAERHLGSDSVNRDLSVGEDLDLLAVTDDRDALACWQVVDHLIVVDDNAEGLVDEVSRQQVAALAGEFIELVIEGHEVLASRDTGVAYKDQESHSLSHSSTQCHTL